MSSGLVTARRLTTTPQPHLIESVLPDTGAGFFYAPSGTGKSFAGLSLGLHVVNGWSWCGHKVKQGPVLMGLCEGQGDAGKRLMGAQVASQTEFAADKCRWGRKGPCRSQCHCKTQRALSEAGFVYLMEAYHLDIPGELAALRGFVKLIPGIRLLILDHATGHSQGTIEWPTHAKRFMNAAQAIAQDFGIFVLMIHHMDKSERSMRGSQVLWDMSDVIIRMQGDEKGGSLISEKAKSDCKFDPLAYELEPVAWNDPDAIDDDNPGGDVSTLAFRGIDTRLEMEQSLIADMNAPPRALPPRSAIGGEVKQWTPVKERQHAEQMLRLMSG